MSENDKTTLTRHTSCQHFITKIFAIRKKKFRERSKWMLSLQRNMAHHLTKAGKRKANKSVTRAPSRLIPGNKIKPISFMYLPT
jgi:hypothetical protein